jgi:transposase InsO family protein
MQNVEPLTERQIGEFLRGSEVIEFAGQSRAEVYAMVQESLVRQEYFRQGRKQRGLIRAYLSKWTGRSLPQMTRLIRQQKANGEIRKGMPGYTRIDTVHQGDWEGAKGVYRINAVDAVTQWEIAGCVEKISEQYLLPVLEAIRHQFPFRIVGFHPDNGSEFVNRKVEEMLDGLSIEFTKSRANGSQDNALVEGKNGAVIRKYIG